MRQVGRKRVAAVVAPLIASGLVASMGARLAGAATGSRTDDFTFESSVSGESVTCNI
jgi:hypothetical protein